MNQDIAEHLRRMSSRNGRDWLRDSASDADNELPFGTNTQSANDVSPPQAAVSPTYHESVVVAIPDVAAQNKIASGRSVRTAAPISQPAQIQPVPVPQPAPADGAAPQQAPIENTTQVRVDQAETVVQPNAKRRVANQTPAVVGSGAPVDSRLPPPPQQDDAVVAARSSQSKETEDAIMKIADEIVSAFPIASPSVVMIAGSEVSVAVDETAARVSAELASRGLGRVLLIDSDFADHRLTTASGVNKHAGLSEVMNIALPWSEAVLKSGSSKLDFMPAGICAHKRWTPKRLLREALAEIRQDYQFVCVTVGDAHSSAASTWSEISDGAMLVVSASTSSDALAKSAVHELRKDGARMLGCIVADAIE